MARPDEPVLSQRIAASGELHHRIWAEKALELETLLEHYRKAVREAVPIIDSLHAVLSHGHATDSDFDTLLHQLAQAIAFNVPFSEIPRPVGLPDNHDRICREEASRAVDAWVRSGESKS